MNPFRTRLCCALVLCTAPLAALPEADAEAAPAVVTATYRCAGDRTIVAVMDVTDPEHATTTISVAGDAALQQVELRQVMSANGVKTSNGKLVWWTRGDEGFLAEEDPPAGSGEVLIGDCREVAAE